MTNARPPGDRPRQDCPPLSLLRPRYVGARAALVLALAHPSWCLVWIPLRPSWRLLVAQPPCVIARCERATAMDYVVNTSWGTTLDRPKGAQPPPGRRHRLPIFSTPHRENHYPVTLRPPHHHPYALGVVGTERGAQRVSPLRSKTSDAFITSPNETLAHVISLPISPAPVSARRVATWTPLH